MNFGQRKASRTFSRRTRLLGQEMVLQHVVLCLSFVAAAAVAFSCFPFHENAPGPEFFKALLPALLAAMVFIVQLAAIALRREWTTLENAASQDSVTGILNRAHFEKMLEEETRRSGRYHYPLTLCVVDIQGFRAYNDQFGRRKGDERLRQFASFLKGHVRFADCVARLHQDEFGILLPHTDLLRAEKFLARLQAQSEERLDCGFSAGITHFQVGESKSQFVMRATWALSQARREGRGKFRFVIPESAGTAQP